MQSTLLFSEIFFFLTLLCSFSRCDYGLIDNPFCCLKSKMQFRSLLLVGVTVICLIIGVDTKLYGRNIDNYLEIFGITTS
jgi:hypothetical protein